MYNKETNKETVVITKGASNTYYERNKDKLKAYGKEYYKKNKDKMDAYVYQWQSKQEGGAEGYRKRYYSNNKDKIVAYGKAYSLMKYYGITVDEYATMYDAQQGCCAVCGKHKTTLCVDHNHNNNLIRALLCRSCNAALGYVQEDKNILKKMIEYIDYHNI